jgi:hypothetical protein
MICIYIYIYICICCPDLCISCACISEPVLPRNISSCSSGGPCMSPTFDRATRAGSYLALLLHLGDSVSRHLLRPAPCVPTGSACPAPVVPVQPPGQCDSEVAGRVVELLLPRLNASAVEAAGPPEVAKLPWEFLLLSIFNILCNFWNLFLHYFRRRLGRARRLVRPRGRTSSSSPPRDTVRDSLPKVLVNWLPPTPPAPAAVKPKLGGLGPKRPSDIRALSSTS